MPGNDRRQAALDFCESFVPGGFNKPTVASDQRFAQAVRIFMKILKRYAFGTEIAMAKDIGGVPANAFYAAFRHGNFKTTACFTKRAYSMVNSFFCFDH